MFFSKRWASLGWKNIAIAFLPVAVILALIATIVTWASPGSASIVVPLCVLGLIVHAVIVALGAKRIIASAKQNESELILSPVFHANPFPTSLTTLDDGRYVGVNEAWVRLFGYSSDEAVDNTSLELNIWVHSEERAELIRQLQATGAVRDFEHLARTKSGEVRRVLVSAQVIERAGVRYNLALVHDITELKRAEEHARRQNAYLETLHQVTLGIIRELKVNELLATIVERAVGLIDATYGWVYLITPEQDALELCVASGEFQRHAGSRLKRGEGLAGHIWQTGAALAIDNYQTWEGRSHQYNAIPIQSVIGMPLTSGGQIIGVIGMTRTIPGAPFDQAEQDLANRFGNLASVAIVNARLHTSLQAELTERKNAEDELQHRLAFERLITDISTAFINLNSDEIDGGIEQSLAAIGRFTESDRSYVFTFSADGTQMQNIHEWCRAGILSLKSLYQDTPVDLLPWTTAQIRAGQVVHVPRLAEMPSEAHQDRAKMQSHADAPLSFINVPMIYQGHVIGLLGFDAVRAEKTWSEDTIALLRIVGEIFVSGLERKHAEEELRKSEARFRAMFESAGIGMAIAEIDERVVEVNPAFSKMMGYSREELNRMSSPDYTHPDDVAIQQTLDEETLAGRRDQYQIEKRYIRKDGQIVWGRMIRSIARDARGKMLYQLGMVEDITERRLAEQKLEEAYRTLEQRVAERTHELATLNAISTTVNRSLDLKEIMRDALTQVMDVMRMDYGVAYRVEGDEGDSMDRAYLKILAHYGFSDEFVRIADGLSVNETAAGFAGKRGEPMTWRVFDLPINSARKQLLEREGVRQVISIPLMAKGQYLGTLNIGASTDRDITPEQLALLGTIGQQIGVAVENARLYEQAERSAQVAERSRLARELHDSVTQSLYSMTLYAEATARLLTAGQTEQAASHLRDLRDTAQEALREMRLLIFELHPPALENGLAIALQTRLDSVESRGGIQAELRVDGEECLTHAMQTELYNIALEALNNALKHASARRVQVHLRYSNAAIELQVRDDGVGFDVDRARQHGGFGISSMRERAQRIGGRLEIDSAPGKGTSVHVDVPLSVKTTEEKSP